MLDGVDLEIPAGARPGASDDEVIDGGRVDAIGTHDELVAASPVYRRLLGDSVGESVTR